MNKKFLLVAAICAAMNVSGFAQTNLVKSAVGSSETTNEPASNAVDNNLTTRWQVDTGNSIEATDQANDCTVTSGHWIYVDLGSVQDFNVVRIKWEGAYAKEFAIYTATDVDSNNNPIWGKEPIATISETLSGEELNKYRSYKLGNQKARYVKMQAIKLGFNGNWLSLYEMGVYNVAAPVLQSVESTTAFVKKGEATDLQVKGYDQTGEEIAIDKISSEYGTYENGKFTANKTGNIEISVTSGDVTKKLTLFSIESSNAPAAPVADDKHEYYGFYSNTFSENNDKRGWDSGYKNAEAKAIKGDFVINGQVTKQLQNVTKLLIGSLNEQNGTVELNVENNGFTTLHATLLSNIDCTATIQVESLNGPAPADKIVNLKAGEWKSVTINGLNSSKLIKFINILSSEVNGELPNFLVSNIYMEKLKEGAIYVDRESKDANGFVTVNGSITSENVKTLESKDYADITAFDLTSVNVDGTIEGINFANPNAMILVAGEVDGTKATSKYNWGATKNLVVKRGDGYYFPVKQLELVDSNTPVYTDFFISTDNTGYKYTRQLPANSYVTTYLPGSATLPEGCTAYTFENGDDNNTIKLVKADNIAAKTPYLLKTTSATELTVESTGDLNMMGDDAVKELGSANANGTFSYRTGEEGEYGLAPNTSASEDGQLTLKKIGNAHIVPFRAYFTVGSANASEIKFVFNGKETGINDINADTKKAADIYSVDGRLVKKNATSLEGLDGGIYIMNGKKYVVK